MHITFSSGMPDTTPQVIPCELPTPPARPALAGPQSLRDTIRHLEEVGGAGFNFGCKYFADLELADRERLRTAKHLLAGCDLARAIYFAKLRMYRDGQWSCAWCENAFTELRHVEAVGSRLLHHACAEQFSAWTAGRVELTAAGSAALERTEYGADEAEADADVAALEANEHADFAYWEGESA